MSETSKLFGHKTVFSNLIYLDKIEKFPNKILINGPKGIGKKILINHFLIYFYSKNNDKTYDLKKNEFKLNNNLSKLISTNSHPNIFKIQKKKDKNIIDIDQIREMIQFANQTSFNNDRRFIIIEDINLLGINSANAILKSIEEHNSKIYYILINNSQFKILETIKSRCIEFHINLNSEKKRIAINHLIKYFNQEKILKTDLIDISPGNYIKFNHILNDNKINPDGKFIDNINLILNLYKKEKNILYKDLLISICIVSTPFDGLP